MKTSRFSKDLVKIKGMGIVCTAFFLILSLLPLHCGAEATEEDVQPMVERINQRYDDFFRHQAKMEEEAEQREHKSEDVKRIRAEQRKQLEEARREYVKSHHKSGQDPHWEQEWNEQQKEIVEKQKLFRRRYVQRKQELEQAERHGRLIPENKEYDLED